MDSSEKSQVSIAKVEPQAEHRWLQRMVGEWRTESSGAGPDGKVLTWKGTETVRSMGELWVLAEGKSGSEFGPSESLMQLGFDPQKQRFVGTFASSDMAYLWVYDGALSEDGRSLPLDSVGPGMDEGGGMAEYRDVIEFVTDDHRLLRALVLRDGAWQEFMTTHFRRKG